VKTEDNRDPKAISEKGPAATPAMAAGLTDKPMLMADLVQILDAREQNALYDRRQRLLSQAN
jgi:hypothetical protein